MPTARAASYDLKAQVNAQFSGRPTLRQVASRQIMGLLIEHYPLIAVHRPTLKDANQLSLVRASPDGQSVSTLPLVDEILKAKLHNRVLDFAPVANFNQYLLLDGKHFFAIPDPFETAEGDQIDLFALQPAFEDLLLLLDGYFNAAQVEYWRAVGSMGVSRDRWLQLVLKTALLHNLSLQGLSARQQACLRGLLGSPSERPTVFMVEMTRPYQNTTVSRFLPDLIVQGQWDEGETVLWCKPSGVVWAFDTLDEFAQALQQEYPGLVDELEMAWHRHELEGDPFAQQTAMMQELMLGQVNDLYKAPLTDVTQLENGYFALSDPAQWFIEGYVDPSDFKKAPVGVFRVAAADSFACQSAFFEIALAQADSDGEGALSGILDLHSYTSQQLRKQLLQDHPVDANYFPDDVLLELSTAYGVPGGAGTGAGDGVVEKRTITLTEFAIGNLSSLGQATITAIGHREDQLIMDWLTVDYLKQLVWRVDIGATYPAYVVTHLDDAQRQPERVKRFAGEWRSAFLNSALLAKLTQQLSEIGLQAISDYCGGRLDAAQPASILMPFALRRAPDSEQYDRVHGMYVLVNQTPGTVVLYRPLYGGKAVLEFTSTDALMAQVRDDAELQTSILDWLTPEVRPVYDHGGFSEPHLGHSIIDTSILPGRVAPAQFWAKPWLDAVDLKLYRANRDLLVDLAERSSVSNAESQWAILTQGAWLLFDVASMVVTGPVGAIAWMVQTLNAAAADEKAIREGTAFERSAAIVDIVLNLVMALGHVFGPKTAAKPVELPDAIRPSTLAPGSTLPVLADADMPTQGKVYLPGPVTKPQAIMDFSFSGGEGFNALPAEMRSKVLGLRVQIDLEEHSPASSGEAAGLYTVDGQRYAKMLMGTFAVSVDTEGVRIVDAQGQPGPWLRYVGGAWRIDSGQRLLGGMPKSRLQLVREENMRREESMREEDARLTYARETLAETYDRHASEVDKTTEKLEELERVETPDAQQLEMISLLRQVRRGQRQYVCKDLDALIKHDSEHDALLMSGGSVRPSSQLVSTTVAYQRSIIRRGLLRSCEMYYNLLADMINEESIDAQLEEIAVLPTTEQEQQRYKQLTASLERVTQWAKDMLALAAKLDPLLESTRADNDIVFQDEDGKSENKHLELTRIIQQRQLNAIDLEFRLLEDLGELSVDRLRGASEKQINEYNEMLVGKALKSAGSAHGELAGSSLSGEERVAVLNDVIDAYEETIGRAQYLAGAKPEAIRLDKLQQYLEELRRLKLLANEEMQANLREVEQTKTSAPRAPVYAPRGGVRRMVRTQQGRNVVGVESVDDAGLPVVQQVDSHAKVLRTFRRQNSQWQEVEPLGTTEHSPGPAIRLSELRRQAQKLIDGVDATVAMARKFFAKNEPLGLTTIVDQHVKDLESNLALLPRTDAESALRGRIEHAITELEDHRQELLKTYYLTCKTPTLNALKFLHGLGEISISQADRRVPLGANDYLDTYEIKRASGKPIWEAHFHYPAVDTPDREFSRGHLKLWEQRRLGHQAVLRAAKKHEVLSIYRGQLRKGDVEGIIPFG